MRLKDPHNLVSPKDLEKLCERIDSAMTVLSRPVNYGGHPFLYSFAVTKEHELAVSINGKIPVSTGATDGEKYYWNPEFLARIDSRQVPVILEHETIHLVSEHAQRGSKKNFQAWQYSIDFCTNARMESDYNKVKALRNQKAGHFPCITDGTFGEKINLEDFKSIMRQEIEPPERVVFCDSRALTMSPDEVYEEIIEFFQDDQQNDPFSQDLSDLLDESGEDEQDGEDQGDDGDQQGEGQGGQDENEDRVGQSPGTLDNHIEQEIDPQELMEEIMVAMERAEALEPGSTPSYIKEALADLTEPAVDLSEYVRMKSIQISTDGMRNQWKRPRKRSWAIGQYLPKRIGKTARWLALLDTSGSMSMEAISYAISQLKSLGGETQGIVVPVDAVVHWDQATEIEKMEDLSQISVVGRGGTVFNSFFEEYEDRLGSDFDIVIVLTDGMCGNIPKELEPDPDCIWALTENVSFQPAFGEVVEIWQHLR